MIKKLYEDYKNILILGLMALLIGAVVGIIDTIFGKVLLEISDFRTENFNRLIWFLPIAGLIIIGLYDKIGKDSIKGMSLVFGTAHGTEENIPKRLVPLIMLTTWITHLFGGSAGREGVAVQIGATISHIFSKIINIPNSKRIFIVTGMAAGFAGLFQTPIAAVLFALEVLIAGTLEYGALFSAVIASFTASYTSHFLGLEKFSFALSETVNINLSFVIKIGLIGIIFGVTGGAFAYVLGTTKKYFSKLIQNPYLKIFTIGIFLTLTLFLFYKGRYSGLGTNLISLSFSNGQIYYYDWILKFLFTVITLSAGYQGGEVTPLFSIGASLGIILGGLLGLPVTFVAALGYAAVFGSATNTLLAPIFIGAEVFGYNYLPFFFVTCTLAYIFNGNKSIYSSQKLFDLKNINI
ncbi:chloride channel protein [Clostridium sp. SM-530-WT-3G]|uniref:chloride channel protein n=1 Tax=Clostridium sp. SM-530-WT-3G TaxID=2725303 RepID=UPI00145C5A2D|nr:chloride channel protein [Clostridium sp. SM-530-WT-3G]NME81639.1 voltage-gated chloride channel protein [Clostridium sp. SM-530-WT-3G]